MAAAPSKKARLDDEREKGTPKDVDDTRVRLINGVKALVSFYEFMDVYMPAF